MRKADTQKAIASARALLAEFEVLRPPVPVERIVKAKGIVLQYSPLDDALSGLALIQGEVGIIGVNALHHPNRQRFSIAHELAHHQLHAPDIRDTVHVDKVFKVLFRDEVASQGIDPLEIEANAFAAELLMPEEFLKAAIGDEALDIEDDERIDALARKFKVSASAMRYRLARRL